VKRSTAFRPALRVLFELPDRLLHSRRHAAVRMRLARLHRVRRLLVVCTGNLCRSPYMAAVLARKLGGVEVTSAGLLGRDMTVPVNAIAAAANRGIDLSDFRSRALVPAVARAADLIVVMEPGHASHLVSYFGVPRSRIILAGDLDPKGGLPRAIDDPWQRSSKTFEAFFDRLNRCAATVAQLLAPAGFIRTPQADFPNHPPAAPTRNAMVPHTAS